MYIYIYKREVTMQCNYLPRFTARQSAVAMHLSIVNYLTEPCHVSHVHYSITSSRVRTEYSLQYYQAQQFEYMRKGGGSLISACEKTGYADLLQGEEGQSTLTEMSARTNLLFTS